VLISSLLFAETTDELLKGFDENIIQERQSSVLNDVQNKSEGLFSDITGKLQEQVIYTPHGIFPHNDISSVQTLLFLDYEHKFDNGFKLKLNGRAYYDAIYSIRGRNKFTNDELDELESEIELYDAYLEGSITDNLDFKIGRQVVVWGRSDTLRVTDILNPLDNRRPGLQDIEYLRLPVTMAKADYFAGNWRITPIAILEQRFSKNPPYGSAFYPMSVPAPEDEDYTDVTYALSIGTEFKGGDINFYAAHVYDDEGYSVVYPEVKRKHEKVNMFGTAMNMVIGDWLLKTELAYFDGLKYTATNDKTFARTDILLGFEYKGIDDTYVSYDFVSRNIKDYDKRLLNELNPLNKHNYQHALRIMSDFMNATLHVNYLITTYGEKLDEGGFQRFWVEYEVSDTVNMTIGIVDYIGDAPVMELIEDNNMLFANFSYNF
jgi:hypothetical protein